MNTAQTLLAGEQLIEMGNIIASNVKVYGDYVLSFDLKPHENAMQLNDYTSVLRGTMWEDSGVNPRIGSENPHIVFQPASTKLSVSVISLGNEYLKSAKLSVGIPLHNWTTVTVSVIGAEVTISTPYDVASMSVGYRDEVQEQYFFASDLFSKAPDCSIRNVTLFTQPANLTSFTRNSDTGMV